MSEGTDRETARGSEREGNAQAVGLEPDAVAAVGAYEEDDETVFYDTENPLAWVQTDKPVALEEMV
ncbi:DUF7331 family protein [Salinibaculum rarum]|uniref:DUF7331 family protein n=1 Tax=Salinibaculum rarum TaxID=3058903 RepID=UPI00265FD3D3|nr:hypothetical protein [Salinibaculum sp. KK48]